MTDAASYSTRRKLVIIAVLAALAWSPIMLVIL